jgi:ribosome-associated protein
MGRKIFVTASIELDEDDFVWIFVRSSGPGGQNVNKVATAVQLRFDVDASPLLPAAVKQRLRTMAGRRLTQLGVLVIDARRFRTQEQNRRDAEERLVELVRQAARPPKRRKATKPSAAARERRIAGKKQHAQIKKLRHSDRDLDI